MTPGSQAVLLLCSRLALPDGDGPKPLTPREWAELTVALGRSKLEVADNLLGLSAQDLEQQLDVPAEHAERLAGLLERGGGLALELERLESLGIWALTCVDADYPQRWLERLGKSAPPVLFGSGSRRLLNKPGLAVVGSRDANDTAQAAAQFAGQAAAECGWTLISGGARGIDQIAMAASLDSEGQVIGLLADSLERTIRGPEVRHHLASESLTLATSYAPSAGFSVGNAMGRNKLIYALAEYAVVVSSDAEKGGTWAGATEALQQRWCPVFVCAADDLPDGNRLLIKRGARSLPWPFPGKPATLRDWLTEQAPPEPRQATLF